MPLRISERLAQVHERINQAAQRVGRDPDEIELVAVSKFQNVDAVSEAIEAGLRHFGESRFQDTPAKIEAIRSRFPDLTDDIRWSFIGVLQSNKAKPVMEWFSSIQSVDSVKLLMRLDRIAGEIGVNPEILLQVNVSGAESQRGITLERIPELAEAGSECENVRVSGLMSIGPNMDDDIVIRNAFAKLRKTADDLMERNLPGIAMNTVSMGMTGDFEIAIEEGSTLIRIGTAIFGPRST
jgi:PLP dependent protein